MFSRLNGLLMNLFALAVRLHPLWRPVSWMMLGALVAWPALADEYAEVRKLQADGQTSAALARADKYIAAQPNDPQMRFIKANILSIQRPDEALALLVQLTRDAPELAEPWNNLAVLHAAKGELDQALEELQQALRIDPHYVTALENLGDVHARLALQAYQRAQPLDRKNPRLTAQIEALRSATGTTATPALPAPTDASSASSRQHRRGAATSSTGASPAATPAPSPASAAQPNS
jgi:tetratricopeptide (TPR) repeat protein